MIFPEEILSKIEGKILSSPPAKPRSNTAASVREILTDLVTWVTENDYTPEHEWDGTKIRFFRADGYAGPWIDLQGEKGDIPEHVWVGSSISFQNPDGTFDLPINLKGDKGDKGIQWKGAWTANTAYAEDDLVTNGGNTYRCRVPGNSGSSFDVTKFEIAAQGGSVADLGITTAKVAEAAITYRKMSHYRGLILQSRAITFNFKEKTIVSTANLNVSVNQKHIQIAPFSINFATLNQSVILHCYIDLADNNTVKITEFTNLADNAQTVILFTYYAGGVQAENIKSVVHINSAGNEVTAVDVPDSSVNAAKLINPQLRLQVKRGITLNIQNKTLTVAATCYVMRDGNYITLPAGTVDFTANWDGGAIMIAYFDPSNNTVGFAKVGGLAPSHQILFSYIGGSITAINPEGVVLINASGNEVPIYTVTIADGSITTVKVIDSGITTAKIANNAVTSDKIVPGAVGTTQIADTAVSTAKVAEAAITHNKTEYYLAPIPQNRVITVNLKDKTLTLNTSTVYAMTGGRWQNVTMPGTMDLTDALANGGSFKICSWDKVSGSIKFQDYTQVNQPRCLVLFYLLNSVVVAVNPNSVVLINAQGVESTGALAASSVTRDKLFWGAETAERLIYPDEAYFIAGEKLPVYKSSLLGSRDYSEQMKTAVLSEVAGQTPSYQYFYEDFMLDPTNLPAAFAFGLRQQFDPAYSYLKNVTKKVRAASEIAGRSFKWLPIGDSLTENGVPADTRTKLQGLGQNITVSVLGTRGTTAGDGRGSWRVKSFLGENNYIESTPVTILPEGQTSSTKYQNPFLKLATEQDKQNFPNYCFRNTGVNAEKSYASDTDKTGDFYIFDFAYYIARIGQTPDVVTWALGTNDLSQNSTEAGFVMLENDMDFMIRRIFEAAPGIKLGIMNPTVGSSTTGNTRWRNLASPWLERMMVKAKALKVTFPNIWIVGIWAHMNPDFPFPYNPVIDLSSVNNTQKAFKSDPIHFNAIGRKEYANALAAWMVNVL